MASLFGGPQPNGTEGIACVKITTGVNKEPVNVKACIIDNKDQSFIGSHEYLLLLPYVECATEEKPTINAAEFYDFRKRKAIPLIKLGGDFEEHFKHQCLPCDLEDDVSTQPRRYKKYFRKTKSEKMKHYLQKYCKFNVEHVKSSDLCRKKKSLFGLKYGLADRRAEFVELAMSKETRKVTYDGIEHLQPSGPLFHGYRTNRNRFPYDVKVVGSYSASVDTEEISIHLFVEEGGKLDQQQNVVQSEQQSQNEQDTRSGQSGQLQVQEATQHLQPDRQNELDELLITKEQHQGPIHLTMEDEERNYIWLIMLLTRVGLPKLRTFFVQQWNSLGRFATWTDCSQNGIDLLTKFTPLRYEKDKVKSGDSRLWDISLFVRILLKSKPPFVPISETALVDGLTILRETRNSLCHTVDGKVESSEFQRLYTDVCNALMLLGALPKDIEVVREVVQQPLKELLPTVKHFASQDTDILRGIDTIIYELSQVHEELDDVMLGQQMTQIKLEELKESQLHSNQGQESLKEGQSGLQKGLKELQQDQQQGQEDIIQGQSDLLKELETLRQDQQQGQEKLLKAIGNRHKSTKSKPSDTEDVEWYSANLKEAMVKKTDFLPIGPHQPRMKTDDLFTNLTFHHGRPKPKVCQSSKAHEDQRDPKTMTKISEIFVGKNEDDPKSILISGEAGIGKTLLSHKILRDWSTDCILMPNIKFIYLITFRQLALLGKKKLTLKQLLNRSPFLEKDSMINDNVMTYIIKHPEQLLVVLDGFDEYQDYNKLIGDIESKYKNDVDTKMPAPVLISKLFKKKILIDSVIMITSRPGEANELDKKVYFDRYVEIKGFSKLQVIEFVTKYFKSKPDKEKKMAVDKVKGTPQYLSFGYVPLRCFFMCSIIEMEIENKLTRDESVPITLTEFYLKVIRYLGSSDREIFRLDNEAALLAVDKTLDNFAKLAAKLHEKNRFSFTRKDIEKLELPEDEMAYLQSSGLILRYPVANDTTFPQTTLQYEFAHSTIQEFFVAWHLVKMDIVMEVQSHATEMMYLFISGLLGLDKTKDNDDLMLEVLKCVSLQDRKGEWKRRVKLLRCLFEYGQEKEFTRQQLSANPDNKYWHNNDGWIVLDDVTDIDCGAIGMLVELTATEISSPPKGLYINESSLTSSGLNDLLPSLTKRAYNITTLELWFCQLDDECADCLSQYLPKTKVTSLHLPCNNITDIGVKSIVSHLPNCLTVLQLSFNKLSDSGVIWAVNNLPSGLTHLDLSYNQVSVKCRERITEQFREKFVVLDI